MVKLAVRPLRAERDRLAEATLRVETAPGRQAQVDGGTTWAEIGGQPTRVQVLVMVLGYSRRL
jgi:transposase